MAHEITQRGTGKFEFCFTGERREIWHGLGQQLSEGAPRDIWAEQAGMDWAVMPSSVIYHAGGQEHIFPGKKLLYRSDNNQPLGIVGADYKIVQPIQVLEFFDDLVRIHGMQLSTAGTLFGGKRFWALAKTGRAIQVVDNDPIEGYVLLTTSADGTMSTQAHNTSIRVVCQNTLNVAMDSSKKFVKVTHHREWDAKQVKIDMGLIDKSWGTFQDKLASLTQVAMDEAATRKFFEKIFFNPDVEADKQPLGSTRPVDMCMTALKQGAGAELGADTAYAALNAATNVFTHWTGKRDASRQFWDSFVGEMAGKKDMIFNELLTEQYA